MAIRLLYNSLYLNFPPLCLIACQSISQILRMKAHRLAEIQNWALIWGQIPGVYGYQGALNTVFEFSKSLHGFLKYLLHEQSCFYSVFLSFLFGWRNKGKLKLVLSLDGELGGSIRRNWGRWSCKWSSQLWILVGFTLGSNVIVSGHKLPTENILCFVRLPFPFRVLCPH